MAKRLLDDALWERIEPYLPRPRTRRSRYPGRPRVPDRAALAGILFVLKTGIPWEYLPQEMGCGSGMTCWRRLRDWHKAGAWNKLRRLLVNELRAADGIDWSRARIDGRSIRAPKGGPVPARSERIAGGRAPTTVRSRTRTDSPGQLRSRPRTVRT